MKEHYLIETDENGFPQTMPEVISGKENISQELTNDLSYLAFQRISRGDDEEDIGRRRWKEKGKAIPLCGFILSKEELEELISSGESFKIKKKGIFSDDYQYYLLLYAKESAIWIHF